MAKDSVGKWSFLFHSEDRITKHKLTSDVFSFMGIFHEGIHYVLTNVLP